MSTRRFVRIATILPVLGLSAALTSCASVSAMFAGERDDGLYQVDDLLDRIEHLQVQSVLSRERMNDALLSLHTLVSPDFDGDAIEAYALFIDDVDRSDRQAETFRMAIVPMREAADEVFARWDTDLDQFTSEAMRKHSRDRMGATRMRFDAIVAAAIPAQTAYKAFNGTLRDLALFMGNDFNVAAVAEIEREVKDLMQRAVGLDEFLRQAQAAARDYVESAALRGQMVMLHDDAAIPGSQGREDDQLLDEDADEDGESD